MKFWLQFKGIFCQHFLSYPWLRMPGNSKIMNCGIPFNTPCDSLELSHLSALQLSAPEVASSSILVNSTLKCHIIITWCCVVITYYTNDSTARIDSKFSLYQWLSSHFSKLLRIKRPSCQIATSIKYQIHKIWYLQKERFAPTIELSAICC